MLGGGRRVVQAGTSFWEMSAVAPVAGGKESPGGEGGDIDAGEMTNTRRKWKSNCNPDGPQIVEKCLK